MPSNPSTDTPTQHLTDIEPAVDASKGMNTPSETSRLSGNSSPAQSAGTRSSLKPSAREFKPSSGNRAGFNATQKSQGSEEVGTGVKASTLNPLAKPFKSMGHIF